MNYREAWRLQHSLVEAKISAELTKEVVLIVEHPPVLTVGRRGSLDHLVAGEEFLRHVGIELIPVERGGDITYHGPGQLVCYPIINLRQTRWSIIDFVGALEEIMIRIVGEWGITGERNNRNRGVWVGPSKIGSVGIAVRRGVSYHGLALNVNTWMEPFQWIHPCGLVGVSTTSMQQIVSRPISMDEVRKAAVRHFADVFEVDFTMVNVPDLLDLLSGELGQRQSLYEGRENATET